VGKTCSRKRKAFIPKEFYTNQYIDCWLNAIITAELIKHCASQVYADQMYVGRMSADQMSIGQMSIGQNDGRPNFFRPEDVEIKNPRIKMIFKKAFLQKII
jgi:hypothetical protein